MGILDHFSRAKKKVKTRQRISEEEKRQRDLRKFRNSLRDEDPDLYRDIMLEELRGPQRRSKETNQIREWAEMTKTIREVGGRLTGDLEDVGNKNESIEQLKEFLGKSGIGVGLGNAVGQNVNGLLGGLLGGLGPKPPAGAPVIVSEAPLPQVAATPEVSVAEHNGEAPPMTFLAGIIINQLQDKNPEQAAKWIAAQPQAKTFVDLINSTNDDDMPAKLAELASEGPDFAAIVAWLRGRPDWFVQTARAVRHLQEAPKKKSSGIGF